jgi:hypothetical protein
MVVKENRVVKFLKKLNMTKPISAVTFLLLIVTCATQPPPKSSDVEISHFSDKVSYVLDSTDNVELPGFSIMIFEGNVDDLMDWDRARNQLLEELIYSNIFRSVTMELSSLVDYSVSFSLSPLDNKSVRVHYEFVNMKTGDSIYTCITKGNRENGNLGFAYIKETKTSYRESVAVQKGLVRALSNYKVQKVDMSEASIAVLTPSFEDANLRDDAEATSIFASFVDNRYTMLVENALVNLTSADIVNRENIDQVVNELQLSMTDLFDQDKAAEIGQFLGADFVVIGKVTCDEDQNYLIYLKIIDIENLKIIRSDIIKSSIWSESSNQFDLNVAIARFFHREAK